MAKRKFHSALGTAARVAGAAYQGYSAYKSLRDAKRQKTSMKRPSNNNNIVTQQNDVRQSKTKPLSRKKKNWKKFKSRVDKAVNENSELQVLMEANSTRQLVLGIAGRYIQQPYETGVAFGYNDMRLGAYGLLDRGPTKFVGEIAKEPPTIIGTASLNRNAEDNMIYNVLGAKMNVSMKNICDHNLYIDVHECIAAQDIADEEYGTAYLAWTQCLTDMDNHLYTFASWTKNTAILSGMTPYQSHHFGKYWKIIKTSRVYVTQQQIINYTMWGRKKYVSKNNVKGKWAIKGTTKDLLIVVAPTFNGATTSGEELVEIEWSKSYNLRCQDLPGTQTSFGGYWLY